MYWAVTIYSSPSIALPFVDGVIIYLHIALSWATNGCFLDSDFSDKETNIFENFSFNFKLQLNNINESFSVNYKILCLKFSFKNVSPSSPRAPLLVEISIYIWNWSLMVIISMRIIVSCILWKLFFGEKITILSI